MDILRVSLATACLAVGLASFLFTGASCAPTCDAHGDCTACLEGGCTWCGEGRCGDYDIACEKPDLSGDAYYCKYAGEECHGPQPSGSCDVANGFLFACNGSCYWNESTAIRDCEGGANCARMGGGSGSGGPSGGATAGGATTGGGSCAPTGAPCASSGECCNFQAGTGYCVDIAGEVACSDSCTTGADCESGCCLPLNGGGMVCGPC